MSKSGKVVLRAFRINNTFSCFNMPDPFVGALLDHQSPFVGVQIDANLWNFNGCPAFIRVSFDVA